jgi:type I restriction enzyme M protein
VLFRTNEDAFVKTKKKLLDECNVWAVVSLPGGVFTQAGAGVKTNILFFTKGEATEKIWYYDLSHIKIRKRTPFTLAHFDHFFEVLPNFQDSDYSWTIDLTERKRKAAEEAEPFKKQAQAKEQAARKLKQQLDDLKKVEKTPAIRDQIADLTTQHKEISKEGRDLRAKAKAIEDAVFDLKAVNPNAQVEEDSRTPAELIQIIEDKGKEVAAALALLKS